MNPATQLHDVDYYRVDVGAGVATIMAELFYDITYGDVDVGIFDAGGTLLGSDGTATSNACADRAGRRAPAPTSWWSSAPTTSTSTATTSASARSRKIATCAASDMGAP